MPPPGKTHHIHQVSFMNYVDRPTQDEKVITKEEMAQGKTRLNQLIQTGTNRH